MEETEDIFEGLGVEVRLKSKDDFLKVRETLTRMGVSSKKELQKIIMKKYFKPFIGKPYHFIKRIIWSHFRDTAFRKYMASYPDPKIHIGCGCQIRPNWFNVDFHPFFQGLLS